MPIPMYTYSTHRPPPVLFALESLLISFTYIHAQFTRRIPIPLFLCFAFAFTFTLPLFSNYIRNDDTGATAEAK